MTEQGSMVFDLLRDQMERDGVDENNAQEISAWLRAFYASPDSPSAPVVDEELDACDCVSCQSYEAGIDEQDLFEDTPATPNRRYLVTATVQVVVEGQDEVFAALVMKELLREAMSQLAHPNDILNGSVIDNILDVTDDDVEDDLWAI